MRGCPASSHAPLKCSRPVGLGRSAADPSAKQQLVLVQAVLVDPSAQQLDEPRRDGNHPVARLRVSGLVPVDVRLGHVDRPPPPCRQAEGTRAQHDDLRWAQPGVEHNCGHRLIRATPGLMAPHCVDDRDHRGRRRKAVHIDGAPGTVHLPPTPAARGGRPRVHGYPSQLDSPADATVRNASLARPSPVPQLRARDGV